MQKADYNAVFKDLQRLKSCGLSYTANGINKYFALLPNGINNVTLHLIQTEKLCM